MKDTRGQEYAERLRSKEYARWKRLLDVQAPYRWNLRRHHLGRTLDVGCGIGRNLRALDEGSIGVDHNAASVTEAKRRGFTAFTTEEWAGSTFRTEGAFDSLLIAHVLEHLDEDDATALVRHYMPYLRPGGTALFICPQERGYATDETHVRFVDFDALTRLARLVGLTVEQRFSFPFPRSAGRVFPYNEFCLIARTPASGSHAQKPELD